MLNRLLSSLLLLFLGAGLLTAWVPGGRLWYPFEGLIFLVMVIWLVGWSAGKLEARYSWLFLPFLGIVAMGCFQLNKGWTVYPFATAQDTLRWAAYACIFFLAFQLFGKEDPSCAFRRWFFVYAVAVSVVSLVQWFAGNGKIFWVFPTAEAAGMGPFLNRDHYATFAALALPVGLVGMLRRPRERWIYLITSAALYASVIASGSRAGFILVTLEVVLLLFLIETSGRVAMAALGVILVFGSVVGWGFLAGRFNESDPYADRRRIAHSAVAMVKARPVHGFGLGTWTIVYPAFAEKDFGGLINAAHNDWLQWGADGGAPMLICILALFMGSLIVFFKVPWSLGVPIVFLHGLIDFPMQGRFLPAVVFLVFGAAAARRLQEGPQRQFQPRYSQLASQCSAPDRSLSSQFPDGEADRYAGSAPSRSESGLRQE